MSNPTKPDPGHLDYPLGLRENAGLFMQQLLQVLLVGMTIGVQRTVLPLIAESDFGLAGGSLTLLLSFVVSFGFVKGAMNFLSGQMAGRFGRRPVLIAGWVFALPIPFILYFAPSWGWIVAANVLLGINQGFAWSMTVTAKHDIVPSAQRGLATGINEFAGYGGVAIAGFLTGWLASGFDPRMTLVLFNAVVVAAGLVTAWAFFGETRHFAHQTAAATGAKPLSGWQAFAMVTWRDKRFMALSQAGSVEKFVDVALWTLVPVYLNAQGASLIEIGLITGIYAGVWGASQLWTGPLSDRIGRKAPAVAGMFLSGLALLGFALFQSLTAWAITAALTGIGMALLYPTLIAAVGDLSDPVWRSSSLGVYRFWRDLGYGIGALVIGLAADMATNVVAGFWLVALAMVVSGVWLAIGYREPARRD